MTVLPDRISVKYFADDPDQIDPALFVPVFHRWIQLKKVEGLLIDVADYRHVHHGPGVLLIGHEGDYAIDFIDGRPGFVYKRKRLLDGATLAARLQTVFRLALRGVEQVEAEPDLWQVTFDRAVARVTFLDQLHVPNTAEMFDALDAELATFAGALYGGADVTLAWVSDDPRANLVVDVQIAGRFDPAALAL